MELPFNVVVKKNRVLGEGTPLYKPNTVCAAPSGRVFAPSLSENGCNWCTLCPFWSGLGYGFEGLTGVYEMNEKKRNLRIRNGFEEFFV